MNPPTLTHAGKVWTLVKHPRDRAREDVAERPWYLRPPAGHPSAKAWHSLGTPNAKDAVRAALVFLDTWSGQTERHLRAQAELAGPAKVTIGDLAAKWLEAGCPDRDERPRKSSAADTLKTVLGRALPWWGALGPEKVRRDSIKEYARHRRAQANRRGQTGDRAIDLELACLSSMFHWAVAACLVEANPFRDRPRFRRATDVCHCNESRPATDEEFHAILKWLWREDASDQERVAGAQLAWCALTGQRPGEAGYLRVDAQAHGDKRQAGARWRIKDGSERIAVHRLKNGINPAVRVHPALDQFLGAWLPYRATRWPTSPWYFPDPAGPTFPFSSDQEVDTPLNRALDAATAALELPHRKPHAMRAFYVRCRRADGVDDGTIAVELGQGSGPGLVVNTYGRCDDILGDGAFDWLPEGAAPAWDLLSEATPSNIIPLAAAA